MKVEDNVSATGVDAVSITADKHDRGYMDKYWIMAPSGDDPNGNACSNAMKFDIQLTPRTELEMSYPEGTQAPATSTPAPVPLGGPAAAVYDAVQEKLLSIPGHAQYFANEIERLIADPANIGSDIRERLWYIQETLPHLPSPETIRVLGNYLYDERHAPLKGHDNSGATGQSCYLATNALRWIGLRESEDFIRTIKGSKYSDVDDLQKCRTWWEEVKSGKRTFSFKGQALEYRFKPDGTWDTIPIANPPDDGPKATTGITSDRPVKRNAPAASETQEAFRVPLRWWYGIGGAVLLAACAWLWRKTTTR